VEEKAEKAIEELQHESGLTPRRLPLLSIGGK
jgi:hypothetical protein